METKHIAFFNLLEALKENCPICFLLRKNIDKSMRDFLYERVNDSLLRQKLRRSLGFCNRHAWQLQKIGSSSGQAIIYQDLLELILGKIKIDSRKLVERKELCLFCKEENDTLEHYTQIFWRNFNEPEFISQYKKSFGVCFPHLTLLIKKNKNSKQIAELLSLEREKISELNRNLKEFIRKCDWRFSKEELGKEKDAWIKAIEKITGKEGIFL
ncbi:MAG: DUF6062 family protein [Candidatus Omnitrophica bacterium]|nr:DUF6062 family protein [Candidatus Omnitrophota bacterium]